MASANSYQDRVQHAVELKEAVTLLDPPYHPADSKFTLAKLTAAITSAETANTEVEEKRVPYQDPTADRTALFKSIPPLVTQALAYVKSNTAWSNRAEAVKKAADKVRGVRPPRGKKTPTDPQEDKKERERGEHSFVEVAAFLKTFIDRLEALSGYAPQDDAISITSLRALWSELDNLNKSIPITSQVLADVIRDRKDLHIGEAGLKPVFDGVKQSVKGQYGQRSLQYKAVSGIRW